MYLKGKFFFVCFICLRESSSCSNFYMNVSLIWFFIILYFCFIYGQMLVACWHGRCTQQWPLICPCYCSRASYASLMENSVSMMLLSPGNCSLFIRSLLNCTGLDCVWLQFLQASWWPVNDCSCCSCSCGRLVFHFSSFFYLNRLWKLLPYWKSSGFREW